MFEVEYFTGNKCFLYGIKTVIGINGFEKEAFVYYYWDLSD